MNPRLRRNIPLMYAITFFQGIVIYSSIAVLYRQARNLTLAEFARIEGISYLFQLLFEIPFGFVADRIGYKRTLIVSNGLYLLSKVIFWQAYGFAAFLLERLFLSMALAGLSGISESILYLSCEKEKSQTVFGISNAFGNTGMVTGSLIFTLFFSTNYNAAALGTVITYAAAFLLSFWVQDVPQEATGNPGPSAKKLPEVLKITLRDRKFLLFLLGISLTDYAFWSVRVMLSQPKFISLGMTEQHIGWLEILLTLLAITGISSAVFTRKLGCKIFMVLGIAGIGVSALVLGFTNSKTLALSACILTAVSYEMILPLISQLQQRHVSISDRATQLSVYAMIGELFRFIAGSAMSAVTAVSASASFVFCAAMAATGIILFLSCYRKEPLSCNVK